MKVYFLRRLLLVPITMLGVTFLVFLLSRVVPGGPMEQALKAGKMAGEGRGTGNANKEGGLSEEEIEDLEEEFGYDKTTGVAYLQWLGAWRKERRLSKKEFHEGGEDRLGGAAVTDPETQTIVVLKGSGREVLVTRTGQEVVSANYLGTETPIAETGWRVRIETPEERKERWARRNKDVVANAPGNYDVRAVAYKVRMDGLLQGNLGRSRVFGDDVGALIKSRIPIALYFGILTALITYGVCLPLGIVKAIKHRTALDNITSILVFVGYSIPGFALGAVLMVYLGARYQIFPLFGLTSPDFAEMGRWDQLKDLAHHTVLPLLCYVVGSFAYTTMMMKNNLMDNLAADYVRTAVAKGVSFNAAVFKHAFRNSIIPIASTLGGLISIIVGGSILIESVFDIQGFGQLQFQALLGRDQTVIMGTLTIAAFLLVIGNILSDLIVGLVDPRVKFN